MTEVVSCPSLCCKHVGEITSDYSHTELDLSMRAYVELHLETMCKMWTRWCKQTSVLLQTAPTKNLSIVTFRKTRHRAYTETRIGITSRQTGIVGACLLN